MDSQIKIHIAQTTKIARKKLGLTQEELAVRIERASESISNIERGKSIPSLETILALSAELGVPLREFFPSENADVEPSANRLRLEAEALAALRSLPDEALHAAITQIKALVALSKT